MDIDQTNMFGSELVARACLYELFRVNTVYWIYLHNRLTNLRALVNNYEMYAIANARCLQPSPEKSLQTFESRDMFILTSDVKLLATAESVLSMADVNMLVSLYGA